MDTKKQESVRNPIQTRTTGGWMAYKNLNLSATEYRNCGSAPDHTVKDKKDATSKKPPKFKPPFLFLKAWLL